MILDIVRLVRCCRILIGIARNPALRPSYHSEAPICLKSATAGRRGLSAPPECEDGMERRLAQVGLHNDKFVVILTAYQIPPLIEERRKGRSEWLHPAREPRRSASPMLPPSASNTGWRTNCSRASACASASRTAAAPA